MLFTRKNTAKSDDIDGIIRSLHQISIDTSRDYEDLIKSGFVALSKCDPEYLNTKQDALAETIMSLCTHIGSVKIVSCLAENFEDTAWLLPFILPPDKNCSADALSILIDAIADKNIPWETIDYLLELSAKYMPEQHMWRLRPLLQHVGDTIQKEKIAGDLISADTLIDNKYISNYFLNILENDYLDQPELVAGIIWVYASSSTSPPLSLISPFIENVGAWHRIAGALLTEGRLSEMLEKAKESGLEAALNNSWLTARQNDMAFSAIASKSHELHRALGRFLGGKGSFMGLLKFVIDPATRSALMEITGDSDLAVRRSTSFVLRKWGNEESIPYLKNGLTDSDGIVREQCSEGLVRVLGPEDYKIYIEDIQEEYKGVSDKIKSMYDWARVKIGGFSNIFIGLSETVSESVGEAVNTMEEKVGKVGEVLETGWGSVKRRLMGTKGRENR